MNETTRIITPEQGSNLIYRHSAGLLTAEDKGQFIWQHKDGFITACDNTNGHCWVEGFRQLVHALMWLDELFLVEPDEDFTEDAAANWARAYRKQLMDERCET